MTNLLVFTIFLLSVSSIFSGITNIKQTKLINTLSRTIERVGDLEEFHYATTTAQIKELQGKK